MFLPGYDSSSYQLLSRIYEIINAFLEEESTIRQFIVVQQGIKIHVKRIIYKRGGEAAYFKYYTRRYAADIPQSLRDEHGVVNIYTILILFITGKLSNQ